MAENLTISEGGKGEKYRVLYEQIKSLTDGETDMIANMANISALIHREFGFWWTGFYIVRDSQLVLGPFQGPIACTRIGFGKGVCGSAWQRRETIVVPDVHEFPGHIACSSLSQSEIVFPMFHEISYILFAPNVTGIEIYPYGGMVRFRNAIAMR